MNNEDSIRKHISCLELGIGTITVIIMVNRSNSPATNGPARFDNVDNLVFGPCRSRPVRYPGSKQAPYGMT